MAKTSRSCSKVRLWFRSFLQLKCLVFLISLELVHFHVSSLYEEHNFKPQEKEEKKRKKNCEKNETKEKKEKIEKMKRQLRAGLEARFSITFRLAYISLTQT